MPQFRPRQTKRAQELRNNATEAEQRLWGRLRHRRLAGFKFSRQMAVGPFVCDFLCRERGLVVELDGGQHADRTVEDDRRTSYLNARGMVVLRFWNNEVLQNIEGLFLESQTFIHMTQLFGQYRRNMPRLMRIFRQHRLNHFCA